MRRILMPGPSNCCNYCTPRHANRLLFLSADLFIDGYMQHPCPLPLPTHPSTEHQSQFHLGETEICNFYQ
jgi:hypothetical protein